jgi:hypothetical protein
VLWWLIGAWVASGLSIPVLWLLSMAGRKVLVRSSHDVHAGAAAPSPDSKLATSNRGHIGRYFLYGLSVVGAVILLLLGSFSDPITTIGDMYSAFANAQAPASQPVVASSPIEVQLVAANPPARSAEVEDIARRVEVVAVQRLPEWTVTAMSAATPPASPERPGKRDWHHGRRGPLGAYVALSSRGTWLFPPNANGGGNN